MDTNELKALADQVMTDRRFCGDENHKTLADGVLVLIAESKELAHEVTVVEFQKKMLGEGLRKDRAEIERLKASLSAPESVTADPAADYDALRKQFLALRTLANSNARMVSHWRNQCGAETREALLANADNVSAERDTNQVLTDALLAAEDERDQFKAGNEALRKALTDIRENSSDLGACECAADALADFRSQ